MSEPNGTTDFDRVAALVRKAQEGQQDAITDLYKLYYPPIYHYVRKRLGRDDSAADVTQEIFMQVMLKIKDVRDPKAFQSWLYRLASTQCRLHQERALRRRQEEAVYSLDDMIWGEGGNSPHAFDAGLVSAECDPVEEEIASEQREELLAHIKALSAAQKDVLIFHYYLGFSTDEIAGIISVSSAAVRKRLHDARRALREAFAAQGISSSAGSSDVTIRQILDDPDDQVGDARKKHQIAERLAMLAPSLTTAGLSARMQRVKRPDSIKGMPGQVASAATQGGLDKISLSARIAVSAMTTVLVISGGVGVGMMRAAQAVNTPSAPVLVARQLTAARVPEKAPAATTTGDNTPAPTEETPQAAAEVAPAAAAAVAPAPEQIPEPAPPTIRVAHMQLEYPVGATTSAATILADAQTSALAADGDALPVSLTGYNNIDFSQPGIAVVFLHTADEYGTQAETVTLSIHIAEEKEEEKSIREEKSALPIGAGMGEGGVF
ncbi:MAG: sigma-70 family RNA polymerase sigma factor [Actinomycetia bacterium]|nr:sigma-70 family RNA polymerase sigma factor [Actinomycetes bacterium]